MEASEGDVLGCMCECGCAQCGRRGPGARGRLGGSRGANGCMLEGRRCLSGLLRNAVAVDFRKGLIADDIVSAHDVKEYFRTQAVDRFFSMGLWEEVSDAIATWRDIEKAACAPDPLSKILEKYRRFPTVEVVRQRLGAVEGEAYKSAMESLENSAVGNAMPDERSSVRWRKFDLQVTVQLITEVIAPYAMDNYMLMTAYDKFEREVRARRREVRWLGAKDAVRRKAFVVSLGIWIPIVTDMCKWRADAQCAPLMPEFEVLLSRFRKRMRSMHGFSQYIPRRHYCGNSSPAKLKTNMLNMKRYLEGYIAPGAVSSDEGDEGGDDETIERDGDGGVEEEGDVKQDEEANGSGCDGDVCGNEADDNGVGINDDSSSGAASSGAAVDVCRAVGRANNGMECEDMKGRDTEGRGRECREKCVGEEKLKCEDKSTVVVTAAARAGGEELEDVGKEKVREEKMGKELEDHTSTSEICVSNSGKRSPEQLEAGLLNDKGGRESARGKGVVTPIANQRKEESEGKLLCEQRLRELTEFVWKDFWVDDEPATSLRSPSLSSPSSSSCISSVGKSLFTGKVQRREEDAVGEESDNVVRKRRRIEGERMVKETRVELQENIEETGNGMRVEDSVMAFPWDAFFNNMGNM